MDKIFEEVLERKQERIMMLRERQKLIEHTDSKLSSSLIRNTLENFLSRIKGFFLLTSGGLLLILSIILIIAPGTIYRIESITTRPEVIAKIKISEYSDFIEIKKPKKFENKITNEIKTQNRIYIRIGALITLILSLLLIASRNHIKTIREKNKIIFDAHNLTLNIINDYKTFIKQEIDEFNDIKVYSTKGKQEN